MIRVNRFSLKKQKERDYKFRQLKIKKIKEQLDSVSYNMDQSTCIFRINQIITVRQHFMSIQVFMRPLVGIFQGIEFTPQIFYYFQTKKNRLSFQAPKIYNDRRVFHPNISLLDCQIVVPQLVKDWNPAYTYIHVLRRLKFILLQPNPHFVPNNQHNKKAAFTYKMRRQNYRNQILSNTPIYLDSVVEDLLKESNYFTKNPCQSRMIDEADQDFQDDGIYDDKQDQKALFQSKYFDIDSLFKPIKSNKREEPISTISCKQYTNANNYEADDQNLMEILNKQIKSIRIGDNQNNDNGLNRILDTNMPFESYFKEDKKASQIDHYN